MINFNLIVGGVMKKAIILFLILVLAGTGTVNAKRKKSLNKIYREIRTLKIEDVDLSVLEDGVYEGTFTYLGFPHIVAVTVAGKKITGIEIVQGGVTRYGKEAEAITDVVIEKQSPNVDAISGATTTSKALLKAIELALTMKTQEVLYER
jgi:uncharacterized protein with FMN-binding domain